jgi:peptidase E
MKLLLSGGNAEGVVTLDEFFASQIDLSRTVLYVPVADKETNYDQRFEWFKRTYNKYGIVNIEMCIDLNKAVISDKYTAIYIGGGNTFNLMGGILPSS